MNDTDDERPNRTPVPRVWREEFDGIKPIRPIAYKKAGAPNRRRMKVEKKNPLKTFCKCGHTKGAHKQGQPAYKGRQDTSCSFRNAPVDPCSCLRFTPAGK